MRFYQEQTWYVGKKTLWGGEKHPPTKLWSTLHMRIYHLPTVILLQINDAWVEKPSRWLLQRFAEGFPYFTPEWPVLWMLLESEIRLQSCGCRKVTWRGGFGHQEHFPPNAYLLITAITTAALCLFGAIVVFVFCWPVSASVSGVAGWGGFVRGALLCFYFSIFNNVIIFIRLDKSRERGILMQLSFTFFPTQTVGTSFWSS